MRRIFLAALALVIGCLGGTAPAALPADATVLLVGNSLTYWNDMPAMVQALADSAATPELRVAVVAFPDFSLGDHLAHGAAGRAIARGRWRAVVLQQGPSALEASRTDLLESARRFATEIRAAGARPALYAPWPSQQRSADFDRSAESYRLAAEAVDGMLFPVGEAWRAAWRRDSTLALYDADGLHPSVLGSYLAALVIHASLAGTPPVARPTLRMSTGAVVRVDATTASVLRDAAAEAVERFGRR